MTVLHARAFHHRIGSHTRPLVVTCDDGCRYVVKALGDGVTRPGQGGNVTCRRSLVNDHVIGRLANAMGAPVPAVRLVHLSREFVAQAGQVDILPGLAHGSREIPSAQQCVIAPSFGSGGFAGYIVVDHVWPAVRAMENRSRFAQMAVLHTWVGLPGRSFGQGIFEACPPWRVYSVDHESHGFVLPREPLPETSEDCLRLWTDGPVGLTAADVVAAVAPLKDLTESAIVEVFASVPPEWALPDGKLDRMCGTLLERRMSVVSMVEAFADSVAA